ncbi:MAG TPA: cell division protein ZapD [Methylophilaceae bacterium]|nr:cell division protein ZapD [Methylophilaceae bacterium]
MPSYDYPFNERIRTLLRLEDLFAKVLHNIQSDHQVNHHNALLSLFQILDVSERAELKADLLQEMDRQKIVMNGLRNMPSINQDLLNDVINQIDTTAMALRSNTVKLGQTLRDNEWLMSIKQRAVIPGGVCEYDMPSYHYWLALPAERRRENLESWLKPLMPVYEAIRIIMHILRGSGATTPLQATHGAYQQMLGGAKPAQMLRIEVEDAVNFFPEVSANKYAISVRFYNLDCSARPRLCDQDINFKMTLCNL